MTKEVKAIRLQPKHHLKFVIVNINAKSTVPVRESIEIKKLESIIK